MVPCAMTATALSTAEKPVEATVEELDLLVAQLSGKSPPGLRAQGHWQALGLCARKSCSRISLPYARASCDDVRHAGM